MKKEIKNPRHSLLHEVKLQVEKYFAGKNKFLLALSGGPDSTVLAHLFFTLKISFEIAHCNYGLRGSESEADQKFVEALGKKFNCRTHVKKVKIRKARGEASVQEQARDARYAWFYELLEKEKFTAVVLGHTANDQTETVLMNLFRGTHIKGLTGMRVLDQQKFRPLLGIEKKEILTYAKRNKIEFRTDSSNLESDYRRNFLRNEIIARIEKEWPAVHKVMQRNILGFVALHEFTTEVSSGWKDALISHPGKPGMEIDFKKLAQKPGYELTVYALLTNYGFTREQTRQMIKNSNTSGTKNFVGNKYELKISRGKGILTLKGIAVEKPILPVSHKGIKIPGEFELIIRSTKDTTVIKKIDEVKMDGGKIKGNLFLRKWQQGDKFIPLGMRGMKKLSDLFTDLKLSVDEKQGAWILCDEEKIIWVVGRRLDDRVKITPGTKNSLHLICRNLNENHG